MYNTDADLRFDKPAAESVVDLINRHNGTMFEYSDVVLGTVAPLPTSTLLPGANTTIQVAAAPVGEDGEQGPWRSFCYRRLDIGTYLEGRHRFFEFDLDDVDNYEEAALSFLKQHFRVELASEDMVVTINQLAEDSVGMLITPAADHAVWTGAVEIFLVEAGHLALELPVVVLDGPSLQDA